MAEADLEFDAEESAVWQEGRDAAAAGQPASSLPESYREDWRAVFWSLGYDEWKRENA